MDAITQGCMDEETAASGRVYATLDSANKSSNLTLSGGDLTATKVSGVESVFDSVFATIGKTSGKWQFEFRVLALVAHLTNGFMMQGGGNLNAPVTQFPGQNANSVGWQSVSGRQYYNGAFLNGYWVEYAGLNVWQRGVLDADNGLIAFDDRASPGTPKYSASSFSDAGGVFPICGILGLNGSVEYNFGATPLTLPAVAGANQGLYTE